MFDCSAAAADGSQLGLGTLAIQGGQSPDPSSGAVMASIYATSTRAQSSPGVPQASEYAPTHNPTRFIGHSHIVGGSLVVGDDVEAAGQTAFLQNSISAVQGPSDSFVALRVRKTVHLRMKARLKNAQALGELVETYPAIYEVMYPGLKSHHGYCENTKLFNLTDLVATLETALT